jgi:hypothetical protein
VMVCATRSTRSCAGAETRLCRGRSTRQWAECR